MKTPYEILDVAEQSGDAEIKQAYLRKVKECPPDRDHEAFQRINSAYEAVKNVASRERYKLFHYPEADFNALLDVVFGDLQAPVINADLFDKLLRAGISEQTFRIGLPNMEKTHE